MLPLLFLEHYNIRVNKYYLAPLLLFTSILVPTSSPNNINVVFHLLVLLFVIFDVLTANTSYKLSKDRFAGVRIGQYVIFIISNLMKLGLAITTILAYDWNGYDRYTTLFDYLYFFIIVHSLIELLIFGLLIVLMVYSSEDALDDYRECRRTMETIKSEPIYNVME